METKKINVEFKVAMDSEQAKLKNHKTVKFICRVTEEHLPQIIEDAMKSQVIKWQSQVRANWTEFDKEDWEAPTVLDFGDVLFDKKQKQKVIVKPVTEADIKEFLMKMSPEERIAWVLKQTEEAEAEK